MQNLVILSQKAWAQIWERPLKLETSGTHYPSDGAIPHMLLYWTWFFYIERCGHNWGTPKLRHIGPHHLGWGHAWPLTNKPLPMWVTMLLWSLLVKGTYGHMLEKNEFLGCRLSRSLKVSGSDVDRSSTYDFLLTFNSKNGPILYRF